MCCVKCETSGKQEAFSVVSCCTVCMQCFSVYILCIRYHLAMESDKHAGWTSEENLAAHSSAISAWESSYKKHLLHFVLSMMLWKINTAMACLLLLNVSLGDSVPIQMYLLAHALSHSVFMFIQMLRLREKVWLCTCVTLAGVTGGNVFQLYADLWGLHHLQSHSWSPAAFHLVHLFTLFPLVSTDIDSIIDKTIE